MKPSYSIARRVVLLVLLVELASSLAVVGFTFFFERHVHFQAFDLALRGSADRLLGAVQDADDSNDSVTLDTHELHVPPQDLYEVRERNGHVLGRSPGWEPPPGLLPSAEGAQTVTIRGQEYRVVRASAVRVVDPGTTNVRHELMVLYASPSAVAWAPVLVAVRAFAWASLVLIVVSGLAVTLLVRRSMEPLKQLAHEAGSISARSWAFVPPPEARQTRELAPLVAALGDMVTRLQVSFAQQRQFVSDSAHELKTAVTVVKSSLQLLSLRERDAREYRDGLEVCLTDCARMEELVFRMLTLARIEEGAPETSDRGKLPGGLLAGGAHEPGPTDLREGALEAISSLESVAQLRRVHLSCSAAAGLSARIPSEDWQTLLSNLLLNAIQHSPPGSSLTMQLFQEDENAVCIVTDAGEGIPPEALPHVFDRFFRGNPSRARSAGEAGLGLAIAKAIVDRARGTITIESTRGAGTRVRLTLPLVHASQPALAQMRTL